MLNLDQKTKFALAGIGVVSLVIIVFSTILLLRNSGPTPENSQGLNPPATVTEAATTSSPTTVAPTQNQTPAAVATATPLPETTPVATTLPATNAPTTNSATTASPTQTPLPSTPAPAPTNVPETIQGLHVAGNKILNGQNQPVRLLGVNRSGTEYACIQGWAIFDGPNDAASVDAMVAWHINAVRVPLNEDCWLNINNSSSYMGQVYRQAIIDYVNLLNSKGLIAILDLHWSADGDTPATAQQPMANRDHSPDFWNSVATTFKNNSSVIFDLFNEPFLGKNQNGGGQDYSNSPNVWQCWRDGGSACNDVPYLPANFKVAGMQQLVDAVRKTESKNIVLVGGTAYSNSLQNWLTYKPTDPTNNLAASWHGYNFNECNTEDCWEQFVKPVLNQVPLVAGEVSESNCTTNFITKVLDWFDANGGSYVAWAWNTYDCKFPSLITDYTKGTPKVGFGQAYHDHLASLFTAATATPTPTAPPPPALNIWWPTDLANLSGVQPFKAALNDLDIKQYNIYWQVGTTGQLYLMGNSQTDGPHKEASVNVSNWVKSGKATFTLNFVAKDLAGKTLQQKSVRVVVAAANPTSTPKPVKPVLNIWWPADTKSLSGVQPFKAALSDLDIKQYNIYWQVDGGDLSQMDTVSNAEGPHKEAPVDVSKFTAKGKGPYTINFVAKDLNGVLIDQKSVQIFVDATDTPPTTTVPATTNMPATVTTYTLSIWWPSTDKPLTGVQPFKARIDELSLDQYTMEWQVEGGPLSRMDDNNSSEGPHKEAAVDVSKFTGKGAGPYTITFVAKDLSGKVLQQKSTQVTIVDAGGSPTTSPAPATSPAPTTAPDTYVLSIWWPSDGQSVSGVQPFKARLENRDLNSYAMFWQVENGPLTIMGDSNNAEGPHKEAPVNVSKFGKGAHTVTFVAKDLSGNILQQKATHILVDTPATAPATTTPPASNTSAPNLNIWWPVSDKPVSGVQPFKARLENVDLDKYTLSYQVDSNSPVLMNNINNAEGPHKEIAVDVSKFGKGTHTVTFVAKDLSGKVLQQRSIQFTVSA